METGLGIVLMLFTWIPGLLILALQVLCVIHVIRTGRDWTWVFLLIFFPFVSSIVYFVIEILPDLRSGRGWMAMGVGGSFVKGWQGRQRIAQLQKKLVLGDTLDTRIKLGEEYVTAQRYADAIQVLEPAYAGIGSRDVQVQWGLAQSYFGTGDPVRALAMLEGIDAKRLDHRKGEAALLRARCYEVTCNHEQAVAAYEQAIISFPGEEARCRYGLYLKQLGQTDRANQLFDQVLIQTQASPAFYVKRQKQWIRLARTQRSR